MLAVISQIIFCHEIFNISPWNILTHLNMYLSLIPCSFHVLQRTTVLFGHCNLYTGRLWFLFVSSHLVFSVRKCKLKIKVFFYILHFSYIRVQICDVKYNFKSQWSHQVLILWKQKLLEESGTTNFKWLHCSAEAYIAQCWPELRMWMLDRADCCH